MKAYSIWLIGDEKHGWELSVRLTGEPEKVKHDRTRRLYPNANDAMNSARILVQELEGGKKS